MNNSFYDHKRFLNYKTNRYNQWNYIKKNTLIFEVYISKPEEGSFYTSKWYKFDNYIAHLHHIFCTRYPTLTNVENVSQLSVNLNKKEYFIADSDCVIFDYYKEIFIKRNNKTINNNIKYLTDPNRKNNILTLDTDCYYNNYFSNIQLYYKQKIEKIIVYTFLELRIIYRNIIYAFNKNIGKELYTNDLAEIIIDYLLDTKKYDFDDMNFQKIYNCNAIDIIWDENCIK